MEIDAALTRALINKNYYDKTKQVLFECRESVLPIKE